MADQEQVKSETQREVQQLDVLVAIGHGPNGEFIVNKNSDIDWPTVLALIKHAEMAALGMIDPNRPRAVIPVTGRIPNLVNGDRRH